YKGESVSADELEKLYENKLESVFPTLKNEKVNKIEKISFDAKKSFSSSVKVAKPRVLIPVFPGTNCEYDSAKAVRDAGAEAEIFVINNLTSDGIARSVEKFAASVKNSQIIFIPGGFSGGDEPDGSGKFITAFFRNGEVKEAVSELLSRRDGLMCGICNGFQALIKLGLVPYGRIIDTDEHCPTLTFNTIARHQSRIVRTRVASNNSPWLTGCEVGDVYSVAISHGEGRFVAEDEVIKELIRNGQVATQYVDLDGNPTDDVEYNPNNSMSAIEGILSPDGRVIGKMGHSERIGNGLYKNVIGEYDMKLFASAVKYFK
ncbi:MAG: phosphoribosylformylglycinamidine synthase subunit PurQ, partial [Clostridia bacterium]|nr:phosphoribosylformylglycinamidine synthase subunit PurQ [Clostridia bacterium]